MGVLDFLKRKDQKDDVITYYGEEGNKAFGTDEVTSTIDNDSTKIENNSLFFRFIVEDIFTITGRGTVVTGKILDGEISIGENVKLKNCETGEEKIVTINGIEMFRKILNTAQKGDSVGLLLSIKNRKEVRIGDELYK